MGELLHYISLKNGKVVSVTTDGFVTNYPILDTDYTGYSKFSLYSEYCKTRKELCGKSAGLEMKEKGEGILSWKTRGQYSPTSKITSTSGLQVKSLQRSSDEMNEYFKLILNSTDKTIQYLSFSLRSGSEIFKKGGHVSDIYKDQSYSMNYDNKRRICDELFSTPDFHDSFPLKDINEAKLYRIYSKHGSKTSYDKSLPQKSTKRYKSYLELGVRNFVKALYKNELNLTSSSFKNYAELITFIESYNTSGNNSRINPNTLSHLKRRQNTRVAVPKTIETIGFVEHIKTKFPLFDEKGFYNGK